MVPYLSHVILLLLSICIQAHAQCTYNVTHCNCMPGVTATGRCLRDSGLGFCTVDSCATGGYVCSCGGTKICEMYSCTAMEATDGTPNSAFSMGESVPCRPGSSYCLHTPFPIESLPSPSSYPAMSPSQGTIPSPSVSPSTSYVPIYRMVQWGDTANLDNTLDMGQFVDEGNSLRDSSGIGGLWKNGDTERRMITFRIYDNIPASGEPLKRMICAIYNPSLGSTDGQMRIKSMVSITGISGQILEWIFCDDDGECQGTTGTVLNATHDTSSDTSDGFCVGNFEENGEEISFKFSSIEGVKGFAFEDPSGVVKKFQFADSQPNFLSAIFIDTDGVAVFGTSPTIKFNWQGYLAN